MVSHPPKKRSGMTLVELLIAMAIAIIPILAIGMLLTGAQRTWSDTYNTAHKRIMMDADAVAVTLGNIGRKSNRRAYEVYTGGGDNFVKAEPDPGNTKAVGQAVEFRYWNAQTPDVNMMDVTETGTHYAFIYVNGADLNVDYGQVDPAGIGAINGGVRRTPDETVTLSENVSIIEFGHETLNGNGQGCVYIDLTLTDPDDGETVKVMTATFLRNCWPM